MDVQALRRLKPELELFLEHYAARSGRDEARDHANRFVHGLLLGGDRHSVENIAAAINGVSCVSCRSSSPSRPGPTTPCWRNSRQGVRGWGRWYVVDTSADACVWLTERP
jgi:hypothetical protein